MGRLKYIELYNFKSYSGKVRVDFGDAYFTSIIGPNGSGKSNMMDAISFVLGMRSNNLRSGHLTDLIYRGRVMRESDDSSKEPSDDTKSSDPRTAYVAAFYEKDDGTILRLKRSITQSGASGSSHYRINDEPVSIQEYESMLAKENILIKAKNFLVFQGDVEAIASQSAKDLSRLIEQISGSLKYKSEYEKRKEIQDATANLSSLSHKKKRHYNAEIKQYRVQADEVKAFNEMIESRDAAVLKQVLWKLYHLENAGEISQAELEQLSLEYDNQLGEVNEAHRLLKDASKNFALAKAEVTDLERDAKIQEKVIADKNNSLLPVEEKITITQNSIKRYEARINALKPDLARQTDAIEDLKKDMSIIESEQAKFESESSELFKTAGMDLSSEDVEEYERLKSMFAQATSDRQSEIDSSKRNLKAEEERVRILESKFNQFKIQEGALSKEVTDLTLRVQSQKSQLAEYSTEIASKTSDLNNLVTERKNRGARENELQAKLQEVTDLLLSYRVSNRDYERIKRMEDEITQMKKYYPGVKGRVSDLCLPKQQKYATAVATVFGKDNNSIIIDSFQTAQECLAFMRERRIGIATFIPLDSVVVQPVNNKLRGISNKVRLAIDTVDYDPELEAAINYVCGSAVVCDDLNTAKYVRWTKNIDVKAVTLDGAVIHKTGLMTGGRSETRNTQWNDKEISRAQKMKEDYQSEIQKLGKSKFDTHEEQLRSDIAGLGLKIEVVNKEIRSLKSTLEGRQTELQHIIKALSDIEEPLASSKEALSATKYQYDRIQAMVQRIEDEIFSDFAARIGVGSIREYQRAQSGFMTEISQKRMDFANHISRLNNQIRFEVSRKDDTSARITALNAKISRENERLLELEQEREELTAQIQQEEEILETIQGSVSAKRTGLAGLSHEIADYRQKHLAAQKQLDVIQKSTVLHQEESFKISMGRVKTLKNCKIEGIELPLLEGSLNMIRLEGAHNENEDEDEEIDIEKDQQESLQGIRVDFSELDEELKQDSSESIGESLEREIKILTINLEKMVVNTRAGDRLDDAEQKLREVDNDFEKTRAEHRKAKDDFEHVKRRRYDLFNKAFKHISGQIDSIYKELTKTPTFPLGGTATLGLADEVEPYLDGVNYNAMPPMKRFCDMELLSGGEKTMAALALLFAIHSYHPSPFFVLDEVDAALDNANVGNIARYIKRHAGPSFQFIVISLKNGLFENSQSLVGIYRDQDENSSRALTINLEMYERKRGLDYVATE